MEKASVSDVKNKLSAYLRKVRAGQSILIFDRQRAVARLEAVDPAVAPYVRLDRLEQKGLIRRARVSIPLEELRRNPVKARESVVEALIQERREGR